MLHVWSHALLPLDTAHLPSPLPSKQVVSGETPLENIHREVMEEAGLDPHQVEVVRFDGLVSWPVSTDFTGACMGMYAFLVFNLQI